LHRTRNSESKKRSQQCKDELNGHISLFKKDFEANAKKRLDAIGIENLILRIETESLVSKILSDTENSLEIKLPVLKK
jgi:hypothetical protein